jgi:hypothetical protein
LVSFPHLFHQGVTKLPALKRWHKRITISPDDDRDGQARREIPGAMIGGRSMCETGVTPGWTIVSTGGRRWRAARPGRPDVIADELRVSHA